MSTTGYNTNMQQEFSKYLFILQLLMFAPAHWLMSHWQN